MAVVNLGLGVLTAGPGISILGATISVNVTNSIAFVTPGVNGTAIQLVGDSASPGNNYYYGTNGSGTKGWYTESGTLVTSIAGTVGQVLVNGGTSAQTGAVTLTLDVTSAYAIRGNNTASSAVETSLQLLVLGTPGYTANAGTVLGQLTSTVTSFNQFSIQNLSAGAAASNDFVVNNNLGTESGNYADFGINSSAYTGSGPLNIAGGAYLFNQSGALSVGTVGTSTLHLFTNSVDALTISSAGVVAGLATTSSSSTSTGALTLAGGLGVAGSVYATGFNSTGTISLNGWTFTSTVLTSPNTGTLTDNGSGALALQAKAGQSTSLLGGGGTGLVIATGGAGTLAGQLTLTAGTTSTSTTTGTAVITGGLGVSGAAYIGGGLNVTAGGATVVGTDATNQFTIASALNTNPVVGGFLFSATDSSNSSHMLFATGASSPTISLFSGNESGGFTMSRTSSATTSFVSNNNAASVSAPFVFTVTGGSFPPSASGALQFFWPGETYTNSSATGSSGTPYTQATTYLNQIGQSTLNSTSGGSTYNTTTTAATLTIAGAPIAGTMSITNPYALYVVGGNSLFGGALTVNSSTSTTSVIGGALNVNSQFAVSGSNGNVYSSGSANFATGNFTGAVGIYGTGGTNQLSIGYSPYAGYSSFVFNATNGGSTNGMVFTTGNGPPNIQMFSGNADAGGMTYSRAGITSGANNGIAEFISFTTSSGTYSTANTGTGYSYHFYGNVFTNSAATGSSGTPYTTAALFSSTTFAASVLNSTSGGATYNTTTTAATVTIVGAPAAGTMAITNPYALYVTSGNSYFGGSTAINGSLTVGSQSAVTTTGLVIGNTNLTSSAQVGLTSAPTFNSSATTLGFAGNFSFNTAAASFTMVEGAGININSPTIGSGSTVTTLYGLYIGNQTGGGTNYAIYTVGTAASVFGGAITSAAHTITTGNTLTITGGSNAASGTVTLVAGLATITSSAITADSVIIFSEVTAGGTPGLYQPLAKVSAGSAAVTSATTDTSTYNWVMLLRA